MEPLEPLAVSAIHLPDFSREDWEKQIDLMWGVNCIASQVLAGERPADDLLAAVEMAGVNPDRYAELAIARLEAAIVNDIAGGIDPQEIRAYVR